MNKFKQTLKIISIILLCCILPINFAYSDTIDRIESEIAQKKQLSRQLERKAKQYNNLAAKKRKEAESLANQLEIVSAEISELETNIAISNNQISILTAEINELDNNISTKKAEITQNKKYLSDSIRQIYKYDNTKIISIALSENTLSGFLNQVEYIKTLQNNLKSIISSLKSKKEDLEKSKNDLETKKAEMAATKNQLEYQQNVLSKQKISKKNLFEATKGKEKEYQSLLRQINQEKSNLLGDLEELEKQRAAELKKVRQKQLNPLSGTASTSWYYKQNDPRWKNTTIGHSRSTLGRYGCAVASVAMVSTFLGTKITPGELAKEPIFYKDLIKWPRNFGNIELVYNRKGAVNWGRIDNELARGYPVIVFIKRTNGTGGHYVVIVGKDKSNGKYVVHDPYFGANIYLDSSREDISTLYGGCKTIIYQMVIYHRK